MNGSDRVVGVLGRGVVDADAPQVLADDLGLTRGDGCFDALRVVKGAGRVRLDHEDAHLARFARSAALLDMDPIDLPAWRALIDETVAAWPGTREGFCKVIWTRGPEYAPGDHVGLVLVGRTLREEQQIARRRPRRRVLALRTPGQPGRRGRTGGVHRPQARHPGRLLGIEGRYGRRQARPVGRQREGVRAGQRHVGVEIVIPGHARCLPPAPDELSRPASRPR